MTSEPTSAFVWIWLPGATEPVVCGRLDDDGSRIRFVYARSYRDRPDAVPIYEPELPLREGPLDATSGVRLPLCIDDAMPDSWGRRLIQYRRGSVTTELNELSYLLESGSDRIGALDFQASATEYVPRSVAHPTLDDLADAVRLVEAGQPMHPSLADALLRGTSVGGARPKALVDDGGAGRIAKFSSTSDLYPVVQGEFVAMELARRMGLDVAPVSLSRAAGKRVLLIDRFDRSSTGLRHRMVSALTILGLTAYPEGRYATYVDLAHAIRAAFVRPDATLRELFSRISCNILVGNHDDHGRNHAALIEPDGLRLSPAYDICPQARSGSIASQAMAYRDDGCRDARVSELIAACATYHVKPIEARAIVEHQIATIRHEWDEVCDLAELTSLERDAFMGAQFLNPYSLT